MDDPGFLNEKPGSHQKLFLRSFFLCSFLSGRFLSSLLFSSHESLLCRITSKLVYDLFVGCFNHKGNKTNSQAYLRVRIAGVHSHSNP